MVLREQGERADEDVEALPPAEPADAAGDPRALRQAEVPAGEFAPLRVEAEPVQVDAVRDDLDAGRGHAPALQATGHRRGDGDRRRTEPLAGEVQPAHSRRQPAALHLRVAQGVLGGDDRPDPGEACGEPPVDAGPVQVRVHQVVAAGADQPDQPRQRAQVAVAAHAEMRDADPVGGEALGDRPGVGERHDVAVDGQMTQQQPQLLLGAADAEAGDDVQSLHLTGPPPGAGAAGAAGA